MIKIKKSGKEKYKLSTHAKQKNLCEYIDFLP